MTQYIHLFFLHCPTSPKILSRTLARKKRHDTVVVPYKEVDKYNPDSIVIQAMSCLHERFGDFTQLRETTNLVIHLEANYGSPGANECNKALTKLILEKLQPEYLVFHSSTHEALLDAFNKYPNSYITIRGNQEVEKFKALCEGSVTSLKLLNYLNLTEPFQSGKTKKRRIKCNQVSPDIKSKKAIDKKASNRKFKSFFSDSQTYKDSNLIHEPSRSQTKSILHAFDRLTKLDKDVPPKALNNYVREPDKANKYQVSSVTTINASTVISVRAQLVSPFCI